MGTPWRTVAAPDDVHRALQEGADVVVLDARHDLADPAWGPRAYADGHVRGAFHAHVDRELSAPPGPTTGRHPLPEPAAFVRTCRGWGIGPGTQVVTYDDKGGAWAARVWWLLRDYGHEAVALLDGGWPAWQRAGLPTSRQTPPSRDGTFDGRPGHMPRVEAKALSSPHDWLVLDARTPERYRGEQEPIDPVAGHIPGAVNAPFAEVLDHEGRFRPAPQLRARFDALLGGTPARQVATYCGSGVTAPLNLVAMERAGLPGAALYPGSWSEWIRDPDRPVARGDEPRSRAGRVDRRGQEQRAP